ncbi:MAG: GAF domain-containing protein [Pseudomonadota bacterium]
MSDATAEIEGLRQEIASLGAELEKFHRFMNSLHTLAGSLRPTADEAELHGLLSKVLANACEVIGAADGSVLVLDEEKDELVFVLSCGDVPAGNLAWKRMPADQGVAGWVVKNRKATVVNNAQADDRFYAQIDTEVAFRTRSILAAPIVGDGRVLGAIEILNKSEERLFNMDDEKMLSLLCRFAGELLQTLTRKSLANARIRIPQVARNEGHQPV